MRLPFFSACRHCNSDLKSAASPHSSASFRFQISSLKFLIVPLASALLLTACAQPPPYEAPRRSGSLPSVVNESSGLAPSRRDSRILWTHNDSGGAPTLFAVEPNGTHRGTLRITGLPNRDWEDLASFELDGRAWLLIADVGDNRSGRSDCALYVIPEPDPATLSPLNETSASVAWAIPVTYADGPRDCEAVAVDARAGLVYLLAKRTSPHGLYALPLRPSSDGVTPPAVSVAQILNSHFPQPSTAQRLLPIATGRYRAQPTSMDFAADGSLAVVLSYGDVLVFPRRKNEPWKTALTRDPAILKTHGLLQAEGIAVAADNRTVYVTSEGEGAAILRYSPAK